MAAFGKPAYLPEEQKDVDYNPLLGFTTPAVRIDPHTHDIEPENQPDLRRVAEIVRPRHERKGQAVE
jgi:hypothetical protein